MVYICIMLQTHKKTDYIVIHFAGGSGRKHVFPNKSHIQSASVSLDGNYLIQIQNINFMDFCFQETTFI